jgi:hypothetical protein
MKEELKIKTFSDYLAFGISAIFSPYITATVFIVIVIYAYAQSLSQFLPWVVTFLSFAVIIPGMYLLWLIETKKVTDIHLADRQDRKWPFLIGGISAFMGAAILICLGAARPVIVIGVTYAINAMVVAIITLFWKISIHTALFSALATIAVVVFGSTFWWLYLILLPLGWSRIHRHRHTVLQATAGALLAFVLTAAVFWLFGYF